jgi:4-amino-4-deoxy-L-arabinose transferase-like glycosyltransferase
VILIAALALRLGFLWLYVASHPLRALSTIPFLFEPGNIAYSLVTGNGFSSPFRVDTGPTAWMTPVWPLILAGIFKLFGIYTIQAFLAAALLNVGASALTAIPLYLAANRTAGRAVAATAAWFWAVFPTAILLPYESLWDASLSALLATTLLWATLAVAQSDSTRSWAAYGCLWGLTLLTNAAFVSLLPFLFVWVGLRTRNTRNPILAATMVLVCCLPWTVRNYRVLHAFVPLRSVAGLALWLGNNEQGDGLSARQHPISNQRERDRYIELGEIAYMAEKQSEAVRYIASHPARTADLAGLRFIALWTGTDGHFWQSLQRAKTTRFYLVVGTNLLVALGTLMALIFLLRDGNPHALPLAVFPLVFPLVYYFALAPPRYRHPMDAVLLLLAAIACNRLAHLRKGPVPGQPRNPS